MQYVEISKHKGLYDEILDRGEPGAVFTPDETQRRVNIVLFSSFSCFSFFIYSFFGIFCSEFAGTLTSKLIVFVNFNG